MTSVLPPICGGCSHLDRSVPGKALLDPKCGAFPDGIPNEILLSSKDHRKPFPGDKGIRFDPKDQQASDYADMIFRP